MASPVHHFNKFAVTPFGDSWATPSSWNHHPNGWGSSSFNAPSIWSDFDRSLRYFEREMEHMKHSADHALSASHHAKPYSSELASFPSRPTSLLEHYSFLNPIRIDVEGNRWLNCCFDLRTFKPEEISVALNTKERCIHVEANHEVKDSKEHYVKRQYSRKFFFPAELTADLSKIVPKSYLTTEGLLYVEAALPKMTAEELKHYHAASNIRHPFGAHFGFSPVTTYPVTVKTA